MSDLEAPDELRPWNIFDKVTLALVIISGGAWLVAALLLFGVAFAPSEYEMSSGRWWLDQLSCVPVYLAAIGLCSVPAIAMLCGRTALAFITAALSSALFYALFIADWGRFIF